MNNPTTIIDDEGKTQTPWPRDAAVHPSVFVNAAKDVWPGLPRKIAVACHLEKSDKKTIAGIVERYDAAVALREKNNIPGMSQCVADSSRNASNFDDVAVQAEVYRRALAAMDPVEFHRAVAAIAAAKLTAGNFAAGLAERLSEILFAEFELEALAAESRYEKYSQPLTEKIYDNEWREVFVLHSDPVLTSLFLEAWFLKNYFPAEMRSPKLWGGCPVQWLRDLVEA